MSLTEVAVLLQYFVSSSENFTKKRLRAHRRVPHEKMRCRYTGLVHYGCRIELRLKRLDPPASHVLMQLLCRILENKSCSFN